MSRPRSRIAHRVLLVSLFFVPWPVQGAPLVAGPWLQAATETSIVIMWESATTQPGRVEVGPTPAYGHSVPSQVTVVPPAPGGDTRAILHTAQVTGLRPDTLYHYRISGDSTPRTFRTHKASGTYRVVHVSDTHTFRLSNARAGLASILAYKPDYVILSGDVANTSTNADYRQHMQAGAALWGQTVHYTAKGNHDSRPWSTYPAWFHNQMPGAFSEDYYAFDIGPVHYVGINNNGRQQDFPPGALAWLERDLAESRAPWKIVFMKANPAITWADYASQRAEFLMPLFAKHGVDLVLTGGNSDGFRRQVNGVWYVHAGLGHNNGYWTLDITTSKIGLDYREVDGTVRQSFALTQGTAAGELPRDAAAPDTAPRQLRVLRP